MDVFMCICLHTCTTEIVVVVIVLLKFALCFNLFRNPREKEKGRGNPSPEQKSLRTTTPVGQRIFTAKRRQMTV